MTFLYYCFGGLDISDNFSYIDLNEFCSMLNINFEIIVIVDCWGFNDALRHSFFLNLLRLYWIYYLVDMFSSSPVTTEGRTDTFVFEYCHEDSSILEMNLWLFLAHILLTFFSNIYFAAWLCENSALYFSRQILRLSFGGPVNTG